MVKGWGEILIKEYVFGAGIKRKKLSAAQLIQHAADIYQVPVTATCDEIVELINALGKPAQRKRRHIFRALNSVALPKYHHDAQDFIDRKPSPQTARLPQNQPNYRAPKIDKGAPTEKMIREFYDSWDWKRLSYDVKIERGRKCECCGAQAPDVRVHTDHVKPIRKYWHLRLLRSNLQILCEDCNMGKGSRDETDFRPPPPPPRRPADAVRAIDYSDDPRSILDGPMPADGVVVWN